MNFLRNDTEALASILPAKSATSGYGAVGSSGCEGLSSQEAAELLAVHGPNELEAGQKDGFLKILASQLVNLIFLLSFLASIICYASGDQVKGTFLIVLVGVVCFLNAIGEWSGQDPAAALKAMEPDAAKVQRDGQVVKVPPADIVPGDIVHVEIGDMIPADLVLLDCLDLQCNESVLTGEAQEVNKTLVPKETDSAFPTNMLYKSTGIVSGHGVGRVVATGMQTQVGLIAKRLVPTDSSIAKRISPLQKSINVLGSIIGCVCAGVICFGTFSSIFLEYRSLPPSCALHDTECLVSSAVIRGLLMAVSIIPHGLPLVVMVMLRVGSKLMADRNAVVTRQSAVDYLGAADIICTDKTGTLTEGRMAAKLLIGICRDPTGALSSAKPSAVGFYPMKGLDPQGGAYPNSELTSERRKLLDEGVSPSLVKGLTDLTDPARCKGSAVALGAQARTSLAAAFLGCQGCKIRKRGGGEWVAEGNMSEAALKVASMKGHLREDSEAGMQLLSDHLREPKLEVPFTSKRKMSATVHRMTSGRSLAALNFGEEHTHFAILKGAPDRILPSIQAVLSLGAASSGGLEVAEAGITSEEKLLIEEENQDLARQGLRSLLIAVRPLTSNQAEQLGKAEGADERLQLLVDPGPLAFLGLWGIFDPPRSTVPHSIELCHTAGIEVIMITGDQLPTALAIGKMVGILTDGEEAKAKKCSELHHEKPNLARQLAKNQPAIKTQRSMAVHDKKTVKDCHETEYKDDADLVRLTSEVRIWSRAAPSDKVAIVESLCKQGFTSAMTGDGVNDAPALKGADIGVAMGISGTAVTKNAADLILMDDNFSTIVAAVAEGRKIYGNVQKYVLFNLTVKGSECCCLLAAIFCGLPVPIQGLQQLVNMVLSHILPPMSLAWEDAEWYTMLLPPRDTKNDLILNRTHVLFRWLPFVWCYTLIVMTNTCFGVWLHTGFVTVHSLIGSSKIGEVKAGRAACELAGHLDASGLFIEDPAPFHCRCIRREDIWMSRNLAEVWDQWGRSNASSFPVDSWTGSTGDAFAKHQTPFASGTEGLLSPCTDARGMVRNCWVDPAAELPLLDKTSNCAMFGARIGQTMGYVGIQTGEVLALVTFRTDGFVGNARFSYAYAAMLALNLFGLLVVLYVPAVSELLELTPLTTTRLLLALTTPVSLVVANEVIKIGYRQQLAIQHALSGVFKKRQGKALEGP